MKNKPSKNKSAKTLEYSEGDYDWPNFARGFLIIAFCAVAIKLIYYTGFSKSGLLYFALPFVVSMVLHFFVGYAKDDTAFQKYLKQLRNATLVMLFTSFVLFEGFICVLMFMPIYYIAITIGFLYSFELERSAKKNKLGVHVLPILAILISSEGMFPATTTPREGRVTYTQTINASIADLKQNMAEPIVFDQRRTWFLSIFPLPTEVKAASLNAGDIHSLHFVYKRWFFTNIQEGDMQLLIADIGDDFVRTEIISNSTYLDSYMSIDGTEVHFTALDDNRTEVSITVYYERKLDPAWYFGSLQRIAMRQSAEYLIDTVIRREYPNG